MREELEQKIANMTPIQLQCHMMNYARNATLKEVSNLGKIINSIIDRDEKIKIGDVLVPVKYFYKVQSSGILKHAYDIIHTASIYGPLTTRDILTIAGIEPVTQKMKIEAGQLLILAGFKKVSAHRVGQTPTKVWMPIDKNIEDQYRAEYFFTLLKEYANITDTKREALDDLI
jgi:hypothetical protein